MGRAFSPCDAAGPGLLSGRWGLAWTELWEGLRWGIRPILEGCLGIDEDGVFTFNDDGARGGAMDEVPV